MFSTLKESTVWTLLLFVRFFQTIWLVIVALSEWLRGFAVIDKWFFKFFLVKAVIILIGSLITPFPLWVLVLLSFLPPPLLFPIFFITIIVTLAL